MAGGASVVQAGEVRSARIESLRALAALSVLVGHVWLFTQGSASAAYPQRLVEAGRYGVWLFFALTGYLLFWPFVRSSLTEGGAIDLRRYALNRALRILPLYYVVVVVLLLVDQHGGSAGQWLRFGTLTESFSRSTVGTVDVPIWSLVVEVQFYVLLPLLAWLLLRTGSARRAAIGLAALAALSLAVWFAKVHAPAAPDLRWRYSLPATFFNFTPGMFLALLRARSAPQLPQRSTALVLGGVGLWLVAAAAIRWAEPLCALAAALILAALVMTVEEGALTRPLAFRPLAALGVASYSLYLWHVPVIRSLHAHTGWGTLPLLACGALAAIAVATLSYLAVERPFLGLRRRWGPVAAEPVGAPKAEAAAQRQPETATA
jgi:peptidoglycan/LPS O-acetylase OafA/YrhL